MLEASLPSETSASRLVNGELDALPEVLLHTAGRAALIGTGMYVAGAREDVVRHAVAGAVTIELFVLAWVAFTD